MTRPKRPTASKSKARGSRDASTRSGANSRASSAPGKHASPDGAAPQEESRSARPLKRNSAKAPAPKLDAPPPSTEFRDRDGQSVRFPESNLKRVAARILQERKKLWRYRPFSFPLFTPSGSEQAFHFDFYVYDNQDTVIRLILVVPRESKEVWDRVGRFKRQYPMYSYELWTPERLAQLSGPRAQLGF